MTRFEFWTDGSCVRGTGGWAALVYKDGAPQITLKGRVPNTTPGRMELLAVLKALEEGAGHPTTIYTDSDYVMAAGTGEASSGVAWKLAAHLDLVEQIRALVTDGVRFKQVKGHADDERNRRADLIAGLMSGKYGKSA